MKSNTEGFVNYAVDPDNSRFMPQSNVMRDTQGIMQIVKNEGFLEDLKHRLLGEKLNRETRQWEPISLRLLPEGNPKNERVDYEIEEPSNYCNSCNNKNVQLIARCPECNKQLDQNFTCDKHKIINKPIISCGLCYNTNINFKKELKQYKNDSAQINIVGANELIGLFNITNNPIRNFGSSIEHYKLRQQRMLIASMGYLIDENWRRWGVIESMVEGLKASIWDYISSLFSLITTDKPKSLIENLSNIVQEFKQTVEGNNKKGGVLP